MLNCTWNMGAVGLAKGARGTVVRVANPRAPRARFALVPVLILVASAVYVMMQVLLTKPAGARLKVSMAAAARAQEARLRGGQWKEDSHCQHHAPGVCGGGRGHAHMYAEGKARPEKDTNATARFIRTLTTQVGADALKR